MLKLLTGNALFKLSQPIEETQLYEKSDDSNVKTYSSKDTITSMKKSRKRH